MIQPERITTLCDERLGRGGSYVLYWMQAAQRVRYNHALEFAVRKGNELKQPVVVVFCVVNSYPEANARHYHFMLEGLREVREQLADRGIGMVVRVGEPEAIVPILAGKASLVVVDGGQLRVQRKWRRDVAQRVDCTMFEVETNLVVPVQEASWKEEFSAGTFRPRITKKLDYYLVGLRHHGVKHSSMSLESDGLDMSDTGKVVRELGVDSSVPAVKDFKGGTGQAERLLRRFIRTQLNRYPESSNDPAADCVSDMSPYLHFGQISPLYIALQIIKAGGAGKDAYLEQLIVRRELSHNFVFYSRDYDKFKCLPAWAVRTLNFHRRDKKEYVYSLEEFEAGATHDPYWNAAQRQMVVTGKMHNYMRMYWGKKILEWSRNPQQAFKTALYLNNKYELDGRDANAFAGVAWCFGKHDRAWGERKVFGKIRYMNAAGLERKFDMGAYVRRVEGAADNG